MAQPNIFGQPAISGMPKIQSVTVPPATDTSTLEIPQQGTSSDLDTLEMGGHIKPAGTRDPGREPNWDELVDAIDAQESGGSKMQDLVVGQRGEIGRGQILASTAAQYGVTPDQLRDPNINRALTKRILQDNYKHLGGNLFLTIASYNGGLAGVQRGHIPYQYAWKVAKDYAKRMGSAAAPGTAYAAEGPGGPSPADDRPVDMAKLHSLPAFQAASPKRQQAMREKAEEINRQIAARSKDPQVQEQLRVAGMDPQQRADYETDKKHWMYAPIRRFGTRMVGDIVNPFIPQQTSTLSKLAERADPYALPGTKDVGNYTPQQAAELRSWTGHHFFPQTPTQAALLAATGPMGFGETAPELEEGQEALSHLGQIRQAIAPLVRTAPRRMLGQAIVGGTTAAATGDSPTEGVEQGLAFQGPTEVAGGILGGLGRLGLKHPFDWQTERDIADAMEPTLPKRVGPSRPGGPANVRPFNLRDWKVPGRAFKEVQDNLRPLREKIYNDSRVRAMKFRTPIVKGTGLKDGVIGAKWLPAEVSLKNAEEELTKVSELGWAPKTGEIRERVYARDARELAESLKARIARQLPADLRRDWLRIRHQSGAATAYKRLFEETKALDENTGALDQPKLAQGIHDHWEDLQRQLGPGNLQKLWQAATHLTRGGWLRRILYRGSPYPGAWQDRPGHLKPRLHFYPHEVASGAMAPGISLIPETPQPVGNVPIWMYPPRGAIGPFVGPYAASTINEATRLPGDDQNQPLPGRQAGGPVTGGQPYVVGEQGPELFVPHANGQVVPRIPTAAEEALQPSDITGELATRDVGPYLQRHLGPQRGKMATSLLATGLPLAIGALTGTEGGETASVLEQEPRLLRAEEMVPQAERGLKELPQLSKSARGMIKYARKSGVEPGNIAALSRRVRAGTISKEELSAALKDLRTRMPESAKAAAVIRKYAAKEAPIEVRAAVSQLIRGGKITLQQAEKMLKAITG